MRKLLTFTVLLFLKLALWFRYRVTVKGLDKLNEKTLKKPGGVLFLPNHPTMFVDPTLISLAVWRRFPLRPIVIEYMYYAPGVHWLMKYIGALPIPNFDISTNSLKRKRSERVFHELVKGLDRGENFLIYPAGGVKKTSHEVLGGASGVHQVISQSEKANIVLVRIIGLWGSSFSSALLGKTPPMFPTIWHGFKSCLKNLLFFTPRREVTIEFQPVGDDFPRHASRLEMNRYLENWYNRPDGLSKAKTLYPGETLNLVSYSMWKEDYLPVEPLKAMESHDVDVSEIPEEIQERIIYKLAKMTELSPTSITLDQNLSTDLGLDSLDIAELAVFLEDNYDVRGVPVHEMTTVSRVMGLASGKIAVEVSEEEVEGFKEWFAPTNHEHLQIMEGKTLPEVFLNNCHHFKQHVACADMRSGVLKYGALKMRVVLLAESIKMLPGDHVGILLPSSVAAAVSIFACQLAGKVPVMINWTVGPLHLEQVLALSKVEKILSSWSFLDRLSNVDLSPVEEQLVMLEDVRREMPMRTKIMGYLRAKMSTKALLRHFGADKISENDRAVLLFTSGTESMPKGVPLTHRNILTNQRASNQAFPFHKDDVVLSMLPPFHAFGFTISTLLPLLSGMKVAYTPDPTDGKRLARSVKKWGVTLVCGAPTFLKNMLKGGASAHFATLRYMVSGAEKAPKELFDLGENLGLRGKMLEGYGITECSPVLTINRQGEEIVSVGRAVENVELIITHPETKAILSVGTEGMILVRGPNVFSGYINPDVKSPFITVDGKEWYVTGDLGYLDAKGNLTISGRLKRFVKIGAEMVSLGLVENVILEAAPKKGWPLAPEGPSLAVCAKEANGERPKLIAFSLFQAGLDELNAALREAGVSNIIRLAEVRQVKEIPLMGSGKIHYRKLEQQI